MSPETERLAWLLLREVDRTQTKGSTARLAVPRDPEVVGRLGEAFGITVAGEELLSVEKYLEEHGYLALADVTLTRGTFTITPAGLMWIAGAPPGAPETPRSASGASGGTQEASELGEGVSKDRVDDVRGSRRPWWQRALGR